MKFEMDSAKENLDIFSDLDVLKNPEIPEDFSESFGEIGKSKVEALKKSINEINSMISGREKLSQQIYEEGEAIKTEIKGYLSENEKMQINSGNTEREKNDLRYKKIEISQMQMNEKISCWKDIALLQKELRGYERELMEKEDRLKAFNKILEE